MASARRVSLLLLLLVWGCFQRLYPIRAIETAEGIAFELPEVADGLSSKRKYELLDLSVGKRNCPSECTVWDLARTMGSDRVYLREARVVYGEAVAGTVVRTPARPVTPGIYTVGATVQEYDERAELVRSLSALGDFEVYRDGSGGLRVRFHDRSAKKDGCQ